MGINSNWQKSFINQPFSTNHTSSTDQRTEIKGTVKQSIEKFRAEKVENRFNLPEDLSSSKIHRKLRSAMKKVANDNGSISLLVIGLFIVTVAILLVITNISAVAVAKRSLVQATEAAAQRGVHNLDMDSYYTGKGTLLSGVIGSGEASVPIDCDKATSEVTDELNYWRSSAKSLKRRELKEIWVTGFSCDGASLRLSTASRAVLPLRVPFFNLSEVSIDAHAGAGNYRTDGFYLFGIRIF